MEPTPEIDAGKPAGRVCPDRKAHGRSRVSNGNALLPGIADGRSIWVRRCKDLISEHSSDIPDPSAAERSLIRRASVLEVELEQLETKFATNGSASPSDLDLYARTAGGLRRLLETLHSAVGLKRRAREIGDDPGLVTAYEDAMQEADIEVESIQEDAL
jgi:hypothetical protein